MTTDKTARCYAIVRTRTFYHSPPKRDRHEGNNSTWALADARKEIKKLNSSTYYQASGEYGRAEYRAVRTDRLPQYLR